ncbi:MULTISPECIES: DUF3134 domain-containing protein [Microcoleus]|uniref:DUF3134 domain-containing protein n=1 Tax=Microcoleus anatoxicus PTRS2 TaxID=2705321 RepID=A0ABU8YSA7_9CYAN|nr:MAG: DUF3134 domain-containing protein [Oscillatoriales cyanobacterium]TAD93173.1 MAG: DUF3134 domain-containing protein [Oscillatoriales cyanobacterium]TAE03085.1 MAG: DUF3134 domain-containing protein [Oscillatoriales cyanobacterium]TAF00046.1 MAG: DUF3134 domain-containing protein [Oscillatoriales cyanobacterium]TAF43438.1 MAG: DUF3134 domain-containing protein [Oscillatoriales cyanobacterium]
MYNPSLRQIPRHLPADVIPLKQQSSLLDWLESTNRLLARDVQEPDYLHEEEISELMAVDDNPYDDLDDEVDDDVAAGDD